MNIYVENYLASVIEGAQMRHCYRHHRPSFVVSASQICYNDIIAVCRVRDDANMCIAN